MTTQHRKVVDEISYGPEHVVNRRMYSEIGSMMHTHPWWDKVDSQELREQVITGIFAQTTRVQMIESDDEEKRLEDLSMGPCMVCKTLGSDLPSHHTHCECDLDACPKVICDDCRIHSGQWAWIDGEADDDTREMHTACAERMGL